MELQHRIALLPTEAQMVSVHLAVTCLDEQLTFLNAEMDPISWTGIHFC